MPLFPIIVRRLPWLLVMAFGIYLVLCAYVVSKHDAAPIVSVLLSPAVVMTWVGFAFGVCAYPGFTGRHGGLLTALVSLASVAAAFAVGVSLAWYVFQ
jgi:hypothetical protein